MGEERRLVLTNHARARANSLGLNQEDLAYMFENGVVVGTPHEEVKNQKYKGEQQNTKYKDWGDITFTYKVTTDDRKGDPINLVISIGDKKLTKGYYKNYKLEL